MTRLRPRSSRSIPSPVLLLLAAAVSGCASSAAPSASSPSLTGPPTAGASPALRVPGSPAAAVPPAVLVVARPGDDRWQLLDAASGDPYVSNAELSLAIGAPRPGWDRIVSATIEGGATTVRDEIVQPGFGGPELRLDGRWRLPTVADAAIPGGVSVDQSTIVLVEADAAPDAATSRFAVVQHTVDGKPSPNGDAGLRLVTTVELPGRFAYDTLSGDGRILYVIEHLDAAEGGRYQVRAVDLPSGVLRDAVIVDKTDPDERMAGYPIAQVRRTDGVVMTLYDGPEHPFVHALQSDEAWALCIDLPSVPGADRSGWGLALGPDGRTVYAANGAAGVVVEVDPDEWAVSRIGSVTKSASSAIELAKFGHTDVGPVGQRLVALPNGSGLLVATSDGVAIVSGKDLREAGRIVTGAAVEAIGVVPDGSVAFALTRDGRIVAFEPRGGGRTFGDVAGGPFSGLVAVAPW